MEIETRVINSGGKELILSVNLTNCTAGIHFGTRRLRKFRHKEGETTKGFFEACNQLQEIVNKNGFDITLKFSTANSNLKQRIFNNREKLGFDLIEPDDPEVYNITVYKNFRVIK